ncbi:MAG: hypothetical protein J4G13_14750 [Dehalococcoidia bacterium]|nr:hypothetical protein [Dehalococcoidia bacterium]
MQTPVAVAAEIGRVTYLDPTGFVQQTSRVLTPRLGGISGKVAGLLDNGNDTSSFFFTSLAEILQSEFGASRVVLRTKFTSTRPAEVGIIAELGAEADFLVSGVAL